MNSSNKGEVPGSVPPILPMQVARGLVRRCSQACGGRREVSGGWRRFTNAHEFGHYLMHRSLFAKGLECNEEAVTFRNGDELEAEADTFAAYLLMPLDDFRRQIPADADPTLDDLSAAAERCGVS